VINTWRVVEAVHQGMRRTPERSRGNKLRRDSSSYIPWEQTWVRFEPTEASEQSRFSRRGIIGQELPKEIAKSRGSLDRGRVAREITRKHRRGG
jgi:hypothetical protein